MKTLLAATDFSESSLNAVNYAAEIAKQFESKLILFHSYHAPIMVSDVTSMLPALEDIKTEAIQHLEKIKTTLELKHNHAFKIECVCAYGFAVDEIIDYVKRYRVDLVIMGMHGAGYAEERLMGSITTALIESAEFPVLTINQDVKFKDIKKITLAADYVEIKNKIVLKPLKDLARMYQSHIYVLNVLTKHNSLPTVEQAIEGVKLEHDIENLQHSFHHVKNNSLVDGINAFNAENKIDLLVMIPREYNSFKNIFTEAATKKMAFHSGIPLLTLSE